MKRRSLLALCAVAAVSLVPALSRAGHCTDIAIFSGADTGQSSPVDGSPVRRGLNAGAVGCTLDPGDESLNTNEINPAAPHLIVAYIPTNTVPQPTGTFTFGGVTTALTFKFLNSRWESQSLANPAGASDVLIVVFVNGEEVDRTTYHKKA